MILVSFALIIILFFLILGLSAVLFTVRNWRAKWMLFAILFGIIVWGVSGSFILGVVALLVSGYFLRESSEAANPNKGESPQKAATWTPPRGYGREPYPQATRPQRQIVNIPLQIHGIEDLKKKLKELD